MLELKNIIKEYRTDTEKVMALKGVSLKFRESEFVSILGQSGCGKTTLLNIIGGLDRYTSGDLIINGKSTKYFKDRDWDAYRNYKVGFIFQSYNLIGHQTVLSNVELALTIGGISKRHRRERAIKALEEVGLKDHINKKPNQLSGGQMQRVAIARALVNNPDIILADEPTGALDTKTSVQIMDILKKISKDKLIIMVTHNPELAEQYSSRIIRILDGVIIEDSNPIQENEEEEKFDTNKIGRTAMSFFTALRLSLNNLLTKKTRTILIAFAGSIGIIGIALVQSISNGFQGYVDNIQEETLTSYPLTIRHETTDVATALLAMTSDGNTSEDAQQVVTEKQYIANMLASLSTNDLRSFKKHIEDNINTVNKDVSTIEYLYSVSPLIYTIDATNKIAKLNPSNLFSSAFGSSFGSSMLSSYSSIYSQMLDDRETLESSYNLLMGKWPEEYNEMIIVLSEPNSISDLLVYSLGLRDTEELTAVVTKIMSGETVELNNEPMNFSYEDLLKVDLRLVLPADLYRYNEQYDIYEDMSTDEEYMKNIYDNAVNLKIVGIVTAKEGVTSMALNPGVSYTGKLVDYIIDNSANKDIVKKQIENDEVDVMSGTRFDEKKNNLNLDFTNLISVDTKKLQSAFDVEITPEMLQNATQGYMEDLVTSLTSDNSSVKSVLMNDFEVLANGLFTSLLGTELSKNDVDTIVEKYLEEYAPSKILSSLSSTYQMPKDAFKAMYAGLLKGLLQVYVNAYNVADLVKEKIQSLPSQEEAKENIFDIKENVGNVVGQIQERLKETASELQNKVSELGFDWQNVISNLQKENGNVINNLRESVENNTVEVNQALLSPIISYYTKSLVAQQAIEAMANIMKQSVNGRELMNKMTELMGNLTNELASSFNVDQEKIASAFKMNMSEEEITRLVSSMMSKKDTNNAKTNLMNLGYQDKDEPSYISFYFKSFDGKEHFMDFIAAYNDAVKANGEEEKEINYTDTTGILMNSVKVIVNAVTYVLIAFISVSLVVSSVMIGIITYISVYERTKEIGILRAIGASKRNISSIFNAETFIIGLLSGLFGIGITYAAIPVINGILHHLVGNIPLNATFYFQNAAFLVVLSIILTLIGGLIPARAASKKDPVIALRSE